MKVPNEVQKVGGDEKVAREVEIMKEGFLCLGIRNKAVHLHREVIEKSRISRLIYHTSAVLKPLALR